MSFFSNKFKYLRNSRGLTQEQLAEGLGIAKSTVSMYERGERQPSFEMLEAIADFFNVNLDSLRTTDPEEFLRGPGGWMTAEHAANAIGKTLINTATAATGYLRIPVLGTVRAGIPAEAVEDIIDWEDIPQSLARGGECVGLKVKGDSMEPRICDGDVVIVRRQADCQSGELAVVIVNGAEATVKRIKKRPEGLMLSPSNPAYEPFFYTNDEIEALPVTIYGKVVELRAKF